MKLSQFSGDINKNIMQGKIIPTTTLESAGGNTAGLTTLGKAAGAVSDMLGKVWLKDQNDKIFDAKNDYEQRINTLMDDVRTPAFSIPIRARLPRTCRKTTPTRNRRFISRSCRIMVSLLIMPSELSGNREHSHRPRTFA